MKTRKLKLTNEKCARGVNIRLLYVMIGLRPTGTLLLTMKRPYIKCKTILHSVNALTSHKLDYKKKFGILTYLS